MEANIYKQIFEEKLKIVKNTISGQEIGNYTGAYRVWKLTSNIIQAFKEEEPKITREIKVLDVGCSNGLYLLLLHSLKSKSGFFCGIELNFDRVFFASKLRDHLKAGGVTFCTGDAETLCFSDNTFDFVTCTEVIEHLKKPEMCIKEVLRVLKPGGVAVFTTPNGDNLIQKIGQLKRRIKQVFTDKKIPSQSNIDFEPIDTEHISVKNVKIWKNIFKNIGFEILALKRLGLIWGGVKYNKHPILFSIIMLIDNILNIFPFAYNLTDDILIKVKKTLSDNF
jgi:2-polyprenyl-3-methyl-5-hydroxy-6-metoxy-1,4-benzoquinol methylase